MQGQLPAWVKLPPSVALPYGTFGATVDDPCNSSNADALREAIAVASNDPSPAALKAVRRAVTGLLTGRLNDSLNNSTGQCKHMDSH